MRKTETNYRSEAISDARDMATEFLDTIVEALMDDGSASADVYNDYPDGDAYHHETHVDKAYNLQDAAQLLDDLDDFEETDSGLWDGLAPRDAIGAQAAYTYGNAVLSFFADIIREINDDDAIEELVSDHGEIEDPTDAQTEAFRAALAARVKSIIKDF
jgi:hypothetical protein